MGKLSSIQYLRAVAALLVVFQHAIEPQPWLYSPLHGTSAGSFGVAVFFIISGFIMHYAAGRETPATFLWRRFVRIVPLYWLATALVCVLTFRSAPITPRIAVDIAQSFLFVPHYSLWRPDQMFPILIQGWTLNYELFFYAIFMVGLASGRLIRTVSLCIFALVAIGLAVHSDAAPWRTYTSMLLLLFLAGIFIARYHAAIVGAPAAVLVPLVALACVPLFISSLPSVPRLGPAAAAVVISALALEARGLMPDLPLFALLGNASYSLYLFQNFAINNAGKLVRASGLAGVPQFITMLVASIVLASVLGVAIYFVVERPLTRTLLRRPGQGEVQRNPLFFRAIRKLRWE